MVNRYKVIISSKNIYKEIELAPELKELKVGTNPDCDIRLHREYFFEHIELSFVKNNNEWAVLCSDNLYFTVGDVRKLMTKTMSHGDEFVLKYQNSDNEILQLLFMIDFGYDEKNYDRCIDLSSVNELYIGGTSVCQIYIEDSYVKNDTICIMEINLGYVVVEKKTQYGAYVNGRKITKETHLSENDFISLAGYSFCLKNNCLYIDKNSNIKLNGLNVFDVSSSKSEQQYPKFNRSTRVKSIVPSEKIEILDPPAPPQKPSGNIVLQLMPALAMLAVTIVLRGLMNSSGSAYVWISVISMGIGITTSVATIVTDRKKYKKDKAERIVNYNAYIEKKKEEITECRQLEVQLLNDTYYSVEEEKKMVEDFSSDLFNREIIDGDYLNIRLGTGKKKAIRVIDYKKQEKLECTDELANIPAEIAEKYSFIEEASITVNIREKSAIGIIGEKCNLYSILKNMTIDLATRHYYSDLKLFYIIDENDKEKFKWARFLPHVQNDVLMTRNIVYNSESKNLLFEYLYKEFSRRENEKINAPNIVVFVYSDMGLKSHPISRYIEKATMFGISFVFFEEHKDFLPIGCASIITMIDEKSGEIVDTSDYNNKEKFTYVRIDDDVIYNISHKLAPVYCEEVSLEGTLTKNITLYELLNILNADDINLDENWSKSEVYKSMAAPLGVKTKNDIVYLDLNEKHHGPHGLVAGTTGSGKSEILQTYILSMATLFHPYDIGFVIIDFKGGGMVNQFKNLPHLIGAITNIDGREINRSLLSIKAELRKRQSLFAEYGVNHIDAYIKLFKKGDAKVPLPHLILIVDEFAELKMDQPEFMKELISAARIGRSLGVHLILATQKPSGVVDAQIWSNSKFKLCLKVQNKEDSNEVLKTPLASEIKEPGRAYFQVGNNEIFDLFQSAYSGAPATFDASLQQKSFSIYELDLSGKAKPVYVKKVEKSKEERETQLVSITNYVAMHCKKSGIERLPGICLPPLADMIDFKECPTMHNDIQTIIPLGVYDDPDNQYQGVVSLDLLMGNTAIIGSSQYGKTNLLQVIIRSIAENYSPEEVNTYVLDFGSMALKVFDTINHIGGVISTAEDEKLKNFMRMLRNEIKTRKEIFSQMGITSFASYKEAGNADIPHIVVLVDNFLALKELYPDYEDDLINLCREGVAIGISIVITSIQTNGISYKYMSNFANRICLYCNQEDEYSSLFDRCRLTPKNVPGRGLISINKTVYEFQTYLAFEGEKEIERVGMIKKMIEDINARYGKIKAKRIPEVPQVLDTEYMEANFSANPFSEYEIPIGIDYDTVEFVTIDLAKASTIAITGKEHYGKKNFVMLLLGFLQQKVFDVPSKVYILDDYEKRFEKVSSYGIVERYSVDLNDFETILVEIEEELQERLNIVQNEGLSALSDYPLIVFIIQSNNIFGNDALSKKTVETYKRILKTYRSMKICFLFSNVDNVGIAYGASEMLKAIKEVSYLFVMDDLAKLKLADINAVTLRQYKKPIELGDAYMVTEKGVSRQKVIHVKEGN